MAKEYNNKARDDLFAGTPALEAIRLLISQVASAARGRAPGSQRLMAMDIKRAFLYADMKREVYINLPEEALEEGDGDVVGLLLKGNVRHARCTTKSAAVSHQGIGGDRVLCGKGTPVRVLQPAARVEIDNARRRFVGGRRQE